MMIVETELEPSEISGLGVFAKNAIPKGTQIWRFDERFDRLVSAEMVASLPDAARIYLETYGYPHMIKKDCICIEADFGRFMNHSDNPNTCFADPNAGYAIRDISAGEEITCNYSEFIPDFKGFGGPQVARGAANGSSSKS